MHESIRLRVRSKGKLISTKVIKEEDFKDYLAMAGTVVSLSNASPDIVRDVANHTREIHANVILQNGERIEISISKVKDK